MPGEKEKQDITEEDLKANLPTLVTPPEGSGLSQREWSELSQGDKEGYMDMLAHPQGDEDEQIPLGELEALAKEGDGEPTAEDKKEGEGEAAAEGVGVEAAVGAEEPAPIADVGSTTVSDIDLLSYRPTVSATEIDTILVNGKPQKLVVAVLADIQTAHDTLINDLRTQLKNEELTQAEYEDKRQELIDKLADWKAEERDRLRDTRRDEIIWNKEQGAFFSARPYYAGTKGTDGRYVPTQRSKLLAGALQAAINDLEAAKPGLSGMRLMVEADGIVAKEFGLRKAPATLAVEVKAKGAIKDKPSVVHAEVIDLGETPDAGKNETRDAWATLDAMTPQRREAWLTKHPEAVDAYIASLGRMA